MAKLILTVGDTVDFAGDTNITVDRNNKIFLLA